MADSATPWTAAHQASLSIINSWSLLKLMSIESVMPANNLILCHPFLLLSSIFPSVRIFSNESALCITSGLISFRMDWLDLLEIFSRRESQESSQESSPTPQFKSINSLVLSFLYNPTLTSIQEKGKSKLQWGANLPWSEWPSSKNLQTIDAGEGVEKKEFSCIVDGNASSYSHLENSMEIP